MPTLKEEAAMRAVAKADDLRSKQRRWIYDYIEMLPLLPIYLLLLMIEKSIEWCRGEPLPPVSKSGSRSPLTPEQEQRCEEDHQRRVKQDARTLEYGEKARAYLLERGYSM
jgi:hypothetical protein